MYLSGNFHTVVQQAAAAVVNRKVEIQLTVFHCGGRYNYVHPLVAMIPGKEKAWLIRCTVNACKNRFRFLRRWEALPLEAAAGVPDQTGRAVLEAVLALPQKYRLPIHLYYYEGYSQKEIAELLSLSLTLVQTRMQRARSLLKKELMDLQGPDSGGYAALSWAAPSGPECAPAPLERGLQPPWRVYSVNPKSISSFFSKLRARCIRV